MWEENIEEGGIDHISPKIPPIDKDKDISSVEHMEMVLDSQPQKNNVANILKEFRNKAKNHSIYCFGSSIP